ncbi:MAG: cellobiose phosphorylase [Candidatus Omnitrophica bacterium]|nr:cellobiose phosphorylase [Candidatus Omnitrophota bacterium]
MSSKYYFKDNEFVIENFNTAKSFASFLPGIAGLKGKPMWAFYVNRGQCMSAFGIKDKDGAIMEFHPANVAYRRTSIDGFRTFIKYSKKNKQYIYEPFAIGNKSIAQKLYITPHEFRIEEISKEHGIKIEVIYFTIAQENFPALARIVNIQDIQGKKRSLEIIDGMPKLFPYGMNNWFAKHMSRTIEAWMEVEGLEQKKPFFKLRVSAADVSKVDYIKSGNFYFSVTDNGKKPDMIVDPIEVFGEYDDLRYPGNFDNKTYRISKDQRKNNTTPCIFSYFKTSSDKSSLFSLIGFAEDKNQHNKISKMITKDFFDRKRKENKTIVDSIAGSTSVFSNNEIFDAYTKQTSLDNILRGGYPITIGNSGKVIYVYTRKHGDLERDYNNFVVNPEFYSQGNGNFRDTNQNRRNSNYINPDVQIKDIKDFYDLIQLDGANPLVVKGDVFCIKSQAKQNMLSKMFFTKKDQSIVKAFLKGEFTPGELIRFLQTVSVKGQVENIIEQIIKESSSHIDADHGEGYWIDHWTYNMDLVESFISVYPDLVGKLFFKTKDMMFYDDAHKIKPRYQRYIVNEDNRIRQYNSVVKDNDKQKLIDQRKNSKSWVRKNNGKSDIYKCDFAAKLLVLILNKLATLDPFGTGIEMEADKPGWCDSMNGLPGLLASSAGETAELLRTVNVFSKVSNSEEFTNIAVPVEVFRFFNLLKAQLDKNKKGYDLKNNFVYWDRSNSIKEEYRQSITFGINGKTENISKKELCEFLYYARKKLEDSVRKCPTYKNVPNMYFINTPVKWTKDKKILKFHRRALPVFLEAVVRTLKVLDKKKDKEKLYNAVKNSSLYDKKLGMYKINASLKKESLEIGRSRVFKPGWLENESIWLHMEYKYLLELIKGGLAEKFYKDIKTALVPFQPALRYGKSILENSSFIASSEFANEQMHGTGFVARLSGATAEFLDILKFMNLGASPFKMQDGKLIFSPEPVLSKDLFSKEEKTIEFNFSKGKRAVVIPRNSYAFSLFENTLIIYENEKKKDTFGSKKVVPKEYEIFDTDKKNYQVKSDILSEMLAKKLRTKKIDIIRITLG